MLPSGADCVLVRFVFQRGLAVIHLFAFLVAVRQFRPLAGEDGLLPLSEYAENASFRERPRLFYVYPDDRVVRLTAWPGSCSRSVGSPSGFEANSCTEGSAVAASGRTVLPLAAPVPRMGDRACYREFCPDCDAQVTIIDEECPECGRSLDVE